MLSCIIIEDQVPAQRILKKYIDDLGTLTLKNTFSDALKAIEFLRVEPVDLVFLDIHLPKISGFDFLNLVPAPPHIILTTAFPDYALQSYEHQVVDYLLKPFSFQRFVKAISKIPPAATYEKNITQIVANNNQVKPEFVFIKSGYEHVKVALSAIYYIKSDADYTEVFTTQQKYLTTHSLRYWLGKLGEQHFCQVHKSYIIQVDIVEKVAGNQIFLKGDITIPIGRAYKEYFIDRYIR